MPNQTAPKKDTSALVSAAQALETEVKRFEDLIQEGQRLEMTSDKTLQRARGLLEGCAECEQRMAGQLQAFVTAMQEMQERQRTCMEAVVGLAERVQARVAERNALLDRFAALGAKAGEVNAPIATVLEQPEQKEGAAPSEALMSALAQVVARTDEIVNEAEAVAKDARESDWVDIAREADTLKQQVQSARNKVLQAQRKIAGSAPS